MRKIVLLIILTSFITQAYPSDSKLDILSYQLTIKPYITSKYIEGVELIKFQLPLDETDMVLEAGNLQIDSIKGACVKKFSKSGNKLHIDLYEKRKLREQITIYYHGYPTKGLHFNQEFYQTYTSYFTSSWMVCNDIPSDKATIDMNVIASKELDCIANGKLLQKEEVGGKHVYHWQQKFETPAYTFGFAIGKFQKAELSDGEIKIQCYARDYDPTELAKVFKETPMMISFFEDKTGVKYDLPTYSQILIGNQYQEMSGYSLLKESYGRLTLEDSTETNLISHELAHQWWGNRITCESWSHFWLNEAFATFMSAAYNEYRFGKEKYNADIDAYFKVYKDIKNRGNDKSLVFDDWSNPTRDDRNIVYFKGAYVLHLLRQELGDNAFWKGIKNHSQKYFDKSVTTIDFQNSMEESANKHLSYFFDKWVY